MNVEKISLPLNNNRACVLYDMSGQGIYRENWAFFFTEVDGIIFVVDCTDIERLSVAKEIL
jgi:GTPase SAR1 family protein